MPALDQFKKHRPRYRRIDLIIGGEKIRFPEYFEEHLPELVSGGQTDPIKFQVPFGLPVEEGVKIVVRQTLLKGDESLPQNFDGKIGNKPVATTRGNPQKIGLILTTVSDKKLELGKAERSEP